MNYHKVLVVKWSIKTHLLLLLFTSDSKQSDLFLHFNKICDYNIQQYNFSKFFTINLISVEFKDIKTVPKQKIKKNYLC